MPGMLLLQAMLVVLVVVDVLGYPEEENLFDIPRYEWSHSDPGAMEYLVDDGAVQEKAIRRRSVVEDQDQECSFSSSGRLKKILRSFNVINKSECEQLNLSTGITSALCGFVKSWAATVYYFYLEVGNCGGLQLSRRKNTPDSELEEYGKTMIRELIVKFEGAQNVCTHEADFISLPNRRTHSLWMTINGSWKSAIDYAYMVVGPDLTKLNSSQRYDNFVEHEKWFTGHYNDFLSVIEYLEVFDKLRPPDDMKNSSDFQSMELVCAVAYPDCSRRGAPLAPLALDASQCKESKHANAILYPAFYPERPSLLGSKVMSLELDLCLAGDGVREKQASCFTHANDTCGETPAFLCPGFLQRTDNEEHVLPQFRTFFDSYNTFTSEKQKMWNCTACAFSCGLKCEPVELGHSTKVKRVLRGLLTGSTYAAICSSLFALVMAVIHRRVMFKHPHRLLVYINVCYFLYALGFLPATLMDVAPHMCNADGTRRAGNFTENHLCSFTFLTSFCVGFSYEALAVFIAFSWFQLARRLRMMRIVSVSDKKQLVTELGAVLLAAAVGIFLAVFLMTREDGIAPDILSGVCTVTHKYVLYVAEIPYFVFFVLQVLFLVLGLIELWRVRKVAVIFGKTGTTSGRKRARPLKALMKTMGLYLVVLIFTGMMWAVAAFVRRFTHVEIRWDEYISCLLEACDSSSCNTNSRPLFALICDFVNAALFGLSGVIYSSWSLQKSIWRSRKDKYSKNSSTRFSTQRFLPEASMKSWWRGRSTMSTHTRRHSSGSLSSASSPVYSPLPDFTQPRLPYPKTIVMSSL